MIKAILEIRCWNCGAEEKIVRYLDDSAVTFCADQPCTHCHAGEMLTKELTMEKTVTGKQGGLL